MAIIAIANRKGGVGKSTITSMLAHGFSRIMQKRVLVVDLDAQCNISQILFGGQNWARARQESRTIADFIGDRFDHLKSSYDRYVFANVGDIEGAVEPQPNISLVPGSLALEDVEYELLHNRANTTSSLHQAEQGVIGRMSALLSELKQNYQIVLFDCPPGLSFATRAALRVADKVLVPFRPDYVSAYAVDRISRLIENKPNLPSVNEIPRESRRYRAIVNFATNTVDAEERMQDVEDFHPLLSTRIPLSPDIAASFNWRVMRVTLSVKYGRAGERLVGSLCQEVERLISS